MAVTHIQCSIADKEKTTGDRHHRTRSASRYAYLHNADEKLQAATVGLNTRGNGKKTGNGSPLAITDDIGAEVFVGKSPNWLSQLKDIEALPDRKD